MSALTHPTAATASTDELETLRILHPAGWQLGALASGPGRLGYSIRIGKPSGHGFDYRDVWGLTPQIAYLRAQEAALGESPGMRCAALVERVSP